LHEERKGLIGDAILRIIQKKADRFGRHALTAFGVVLEKIAKIQSPIFMVSFEGFPCPALSEVCHVCRHSRSPFHGCILEISPHFTATYITKWLSVKLKFNH